MRHRILFFIALFLVSCSAAIAQDSSYNEMVGTYKFPSGSIIPEAIVKVENGGLMMSSTQGTSALERMKGDTFNVVSFSGICVFKRDESKKIIGVHVDASGYVMDGVKDAPAMKYASHDAAKIYMNKEEKQ